MGFEQLKQDVLSRIDKSRKGSVDEKIKDLCELVNSKDDYVTLSSCSGRICLLKACAKKHLCEWLVVTHDLANSDEFKDALNKYSGEEKIIFKQEPPIIHIGCQSIEIAQDLVDLARQNSFKRPAILSTRKKIVVEIAGSEFLEAPVFDSEKLISDDYLKYLVEVANEKMQKSWDQIEKLRTVLEEKQNK
ncbi:tRNA wybutosine-synthesizing 3 family protein [Nanoarchaeota archaeon]